MPRTLTQNGAVSQPPAPASAESLEELPIAAAAELDGMEEFGSPRNWVSFDAQRGKFTCKAQEAEYEAFFGVILESRVVRVKKDEDGAVLCASSNRAVADSGRIGRECAMCEDRDLSCFTRWWIAWQDDETGLVFAHTLSYTGSLNFQRYARELKEQGRLPSQVITRIFPEEAHRQKTGSVYRRVQFEQPA